MNNKDLVFEIISKIPLGKVATYKLISQLSGVKSPRVVGNILHKNIEPEKYPCHRVVNIKGEVAKNYAFGGGAIQRKKLEQERIEFNKDRIDFKKFLWQI